MLLLPSLIIALHGLIIQDEVAADGDINIKVAQGELVGEWRNIGGRDFGAFEGIPYAVPPLGEKRYMEPIPAPSWDGILKAKALSSPCTQIYDMVRDDLISFGEEDCLYISIYSPKPNKNEKLPVVLNVHGGTYMFGTGSFYGCEFLMEKDVICVGFNYRLGAIGFLSTGDDVLPGNNGMKDQVLALKWVKDNIIHFGGDPDSITLVGSAVGASSVTFHTISPLSKGLFHRVVLLSGTGCNIWAMASSVVNKTHIIASSLGCPITSSREIVDCLTNKPAMEIIRAAKMFMPYIQSPPQPLGPVVEPPGTKGAFLLEDPVESMKKGLSADVSWLCGVTIDEGLYPVSIFLQDYKLLDEIEARWDEIAPAMYIFDDSVSSSEQLSASRKIKEEYLNGNPVSLKTLRGFIDSFSDRYFYNGLDTCTKLHLNHHSSPIYVYKFGYPGEGSFSKFFSNTDIGYGVSHLDDLGYIFKTLAFDPRTVSEDNKMLDAMVEMVAQYAIHGKPKLGTTEWTPLSKDAFNYMNISGPNDFHMISKTLILNDVWASLNV